MVAIAENLGHSHLHLLQGIFHNSISANTLPINYFTILFASKWRRTKEEACYHWIVNDPSSMQAAFVFSMTDGPLHHSSSRLHISHRHSSHGTVGFVKALTTPLFGSSDSCMRQSFNQGGGTVRIARLSKQEKSACSILSQPLCPFISRSCWSVALEALCAG